MNLQKYLWIKLNKLTLNPSKSHALNILLPTISKHLILISQSQILPKVSNISREIINNKNQKTGMY